MMCMVQTSASRVRRVAAAVRPMFNVAAACSQHQSAAAGCRALSLRRVQFAPRTLLRGRVLPSRRQSK